MPSLPPGDPVLSHRHSLVAGPFATSKKQREKNPSAKSYTKGTYYSQQLRLSYSANFKSLITCESVITIVIVIKGSL